MSQRLEDLLVSLKEEEYFFNIHVWIAILKNTIQEARKSLKDKSPQEIADIIQSDPPEFKLTLNLYQCQDLINYFEKILRLEKELKAYRTLAEVLIEEKKESQRIYEQPGEEQGQRLRKVARYQGLTDGSKKRKSRINDHAFYWDYLELTHGTFDRKTFERIEPVSKTEACRILKKEYNLQSTEAARSKLNRIKKKISKEAEENKEDLRKILKKMKTKKIDK